MSIIEINVDFWLRLIVIALSYYCVITMPVTWTKERETITFTIRIIIACWLTPEDIKNSDAKNLSRSFIYLSLG